MREKRGLACLYGSAFGVAACILTIGAGITMQLSLSALYEAFSAGKAFLIKHWASLTLRARSTTRAASLGPLPFRARKYDFFSTWRTLLLALPASRADYGDSSTLRREEAIDQCCHSVSVLTLFIIRTLDAIWLVAEGISARRALLD